MRSPDLSRMYDKPKQANKWLWIAGHISLYLLQAIGAVGGIIAIFGRETVIEYLEQYLQIFLIFLVIIGLYGWFIYMVWWTGREIWRGIRGWIRKRRDSHQLRMLAPRMARLKQYLQGRYTHYRSANDATKTYFKNLIEAHRLLNEELVALRICTPSLPETPLHVLRFEKWADYSEMLLPLAVVGDIKEARMILGRLEEQER